MVSTQRQYIENTQCPAYRKHSQKGGWKHKGVIVRMLRTPHSLRRK